MRTNKSTRQSVFLLNSWIIMPLVVVASGISVISILLVVAPCAQQTMQDAADSTLHALLEHLQDRANMLDRVNGSTFSIAKVLGSMKNLTFFDIESGVAPRLFMALQTVPLVTQISYVGMDGLVFSYYYEKDQLHTLFSNVSHASNNSVPFYWYSQLVDRNTGDRYGDAIALAPQQLNKAKWYHDALDGRSGYASLGVGWENDKDQNIFFTASVANVGVVSLGIVLSDFINHVSDIDLHGGYLYLAIDDSLFPANNRVTKSHYFLRTSTMTSHEMYENRIFGVEEKYTHLSCQTNFITLSSSVFNATSSDFRNKEDNIGYGCIEASGIRLVSLLAVPFKGNKHLFQEIKITVISLVFIMIVGVIFVSYIMFHIFRTSQVQKAFLCANLIKHKEAVQQAERKSMNKSLAFASASHDVRTSLAGITGLIEICRSDTHTHSEMDRNLEQMSTCVSKLLGILNSVLDTSKVEAGKMQLEEVEFDISQVIEESIDIFHIVALRKGFEVIWDPCDFSILKHSNVKGDCTRLKQILDNVLGNAVKFTSEGRVIVRAWSKKPTVENFKLPPKHGYFFTNVFGFLSRWIFKNEAQSGFGSTQCDPSCTEFVFEVDDTGPGIPKEKRDSVFENFIQVKESAAGCEGTGLGLGIVQSYVRLMGGEISIIDKAPGEKGTCFRFNILLKSCEVPYDDEAEEDGSNRFYLQATSSTNCQDINKKAASQSLVRALTFREGFSMEGTHALLFIQGDETRKILQSWMECIGIKVWAIHNLDILYPILEKIKNRRSSSGKYEFSSFGRTLSHGTTIEIEGPSTPKDQSSQNLPITERDCSKKTSSGGASACILAVIDASCETSAEVCSSLKNFADVNHQVRCKVVFLTNPNTSTVGLKKFKLARYDLILQKPLLSSRLYALLQLLQELHRVNEGHLPRPGVDSTEENSQQFRQQDPSSEIRNLTTQSSFHKPLNGMHILLVEDTPLLSRIAKTKLSHLGATIETSENGLEAFNTIKKALRDASQTQGGSIDAQGDSRYFPYDVVLMDCEMPIMNGYESTRHIREEERRYGVHIPIIALTAHATSEEKNKTVLAGMDFHLTKPIQDAKLLEAISCVCKNYKP
ncbi:probable histidine kinase 2 [Typha angustifolia]|uniref:probable histidine kinase 2 n=1 Tax=Typha angustifolia TaxID=59011 RepID=UPI003C2CA116